MNKPFVSRTIQTYKIITSILVLWLTSLSCNMVIPKFHPIEPIPTPSPTTQIAPKDGMEIIFVAEGEFIMGSENGNEDEYPVHSVYLDNFWIDKTEITNSMYYLCMEFGTCESPLSDGFYAPKDHFKDPSKADLPVVFVTWFNAQTYCKWVGRRLPTEAEWEKAARGVNGNLYPWGNQEPTSELLNFDKNNLSLMPVGSFPLGASPYGVMDMAGNAWEWVSDWYDESYYNFSPVTNPTGPNNGTTRVLRGGGYFQSAYEVRSSYRTGISPTANLSVDYSFRCASDDISSNTVFR